MPVPRSAHTSLALVGVVIVVATLALLGTETVRIHNTQRLLRAWPSTGALRVEIRANDASFTATGVVFPRSDRLHDLAFDGRLSYELAELEHNFTVVMGRGFVTIENTTTHEIMHSGCLAPRGAPPFHLLAASLRSARVVDDAPAHGLSRETCGSQNQLREIEFAGDSYVFCSRLDGRIDTVYGENFRMGFSPHSGADENLLYVHNGESTASCELLSAQSQATSPARRVLRVAATRAHDAAYIFIRQRRQATTESCATTCKDGKKRCLFVHGLGHRASDTLVIDTYVGTWGNVAKNLPCCSETKFLHMDTVETAWHGEVLTNQFCDTAIELATSNEPMALDGLAVISHSMGNLVVTNAVMKRRCAIGPSSKWITLAAPIHRSYSANLSIEVCGKNGSVADTSVAKTLSLVNMCPAKNATQSLVFKGSSLETAEHNERLAAAERIYAKYATASMCGTSPTGLPSVFSAWYSAVDKLAGHKSLSDGAVEIDSCRGPFPESAFSTSWRGGRFYKAALNHADASMRNGDGLWGEDRQPIKWINCQF